MSKLFNEKQESFIRDNVKGLGNQELTDLVNFEFNLAIKVSQIKSWKKNHNITSGLTGRFPKGHIPHNKGKKGTYALGSEKGWFKKGQQPINYKPVGTERIDSKDGYIVIKVQDSGPWDKRWRPKHRVIWEKHIGPIPKGKVLIFLDGDKTNCSIENLKLISQSQNARLNQNHWRFDNAEATEVGIGLAKLSEAKAKKRR